ncbi:MAG: MFS transporter [Actinobacteria bacterium]|nr:MFS transporter [Actinomycetota bacterium]
MYIIITGLVFNTITLYMEPMVGELGITRTEFMMTITILGIISAVLTLFAFGPVVGKVGLKATLLVSGLLIVVALLCFAIAQAAWMLYVGAVFFGIGITFLSVGTVSIGVNTWFAKRMSTMISICTTAGGVAGILFAPIVGGWVATLGWRSSLWVTIVIALVGTVLMFLLYGNNPEKYGETRMWSEQIDTASGAEGETSAAAETGVGFKEMFKTPQFYILCFAYLIIGIIFYSTMGNMAILSADHGLDSMQQGTVLSVIFAATAISMIPLGILSDKFGTKILILIDVVAVIIALAILCTDFQGTTLLYVAAALIGIGYTAVNIPCAVSVMEGLGSKEYGKKMPIVLGFMLAGVALGNPLLQMFFDIGGSYTPGFIAYIVLAAIVAIIMFPGTKLAQPKA